ncbi:MAG: pseudouridine synthase [Bacteroidales bacterium]
MLHRYNSPIDGIEKPKLFTFPFNYTPHPLTSIAANELKEYIATMSEWHQEISLGKMFGVLVVEDNNGQLGYLAAFSGNLAASNTHPHFVPAVFDILQPHDFYLTEVENISEVNRRVASLESSGEYIKIKENYLRESLEATQQINRSLEELKQNKKRRKEVRSQGCTQEMLSILAKESVYQKNRHKELEKSWSSSMDAIKQQLSKFELEIDRLKQERKMRSSSLQMEIFKRFELLNAHGQVMTVPEIFDCTPNKMPPAGAGECAAPKLLQFAFTNGLKPIAIGEFWWGESPKQEIRHHGHFYPACNGKCLPILTHMLKGVSVEPDPLLSRRHDDSELEILFEDDWLVVVNKPEGMLSVPGKSDSRSVWDIIRERYPEATGPLIVHRLDMATSGILIIAKDKDTHHNIQSQFEDRSIKKRYTALLSGIVHSESGTIKLPLCLDPMDRPRQMVNFELGKVAITRYEVIGVEDGNTRISLFPHTGRTHQLRVHCAHPDGLNSPIIGDNLYGTPLDRLHLHAEYIKFRHPITNKAISIETKAPF